MPRTKVAIVRGNKNPDNKEIETLVRQAIEFAGGLPARVRTGSTVLIKPNVCADFLPETAVNTDPRICQAIADVKRRFKRSWEAVEEKVPFPEGFRLIIDERACTGCRNQVLSSLFELKEAGQLAQAAGWCVVSGKIDAVPDVAKDRLLLVGACTARFRNKGTFVAGCPPNGRDVTKGMSVNVGITNIDALSQ